MEKVKVFIADDHDIVLNGIKTLISGDPKLTLVGWAKDGAEAYQWLSSNEFDVAVLDISMKGMSGTDIFRRIIRLKPKAKILFMSMHAPEQYAVSLLRAGAMGYLHKTVDSGRICNVIIDAHKGKRFIDDNIAEMLIRNDGKTEFNFAGTREMAVIQMIVDGKSNNDIAEELHISVKTVSTHKTNFMKKHNMKSISEIIRFAMDNGMMQPSPEGNSFEPQKRLPL